MTTDVKRNNWSRYLKRFNESNRFRRANVTVRRKGNKVTVLQTDTSLLGLVLTRKGRVIDGIALFTAHWDPQQLNEPVVAITGLVGIRQEKDAGGTITGVRMEASDGSVVTLELTGAAASERPRELVEKIAYTMYEQRGAAHGRDLDDWIEAERTIDHIERSLVG